MKVYIVLDQSQACYDAGDVFRGAYSTQELAERSINMFAEYDWMTFDIEEHELDSHTLY